VTPLAVQALECRYGSKTALIDVSFEMSEGVTALVGLNGSGKTSLLRTVAGALKPWSGTVRVQGRDPYGRGERREALAQCSLMPQELRFPGSFTALEVVQYLAWMRGVPGRAARARAHDCLEAVGLAARASSRMRELSGGMVRRVGLAQALASRPDVLLLDEPSTGLDPQQRRMMVELVADLDGTVLLSSHVMEDVTDVAKRVLVLHEGRMAFVGSISELITRAPIGTTNSRAAEAGFVSIVTAAPPAPRP
jgi:ABC-2 type transport system ATP-binding protein